MRRSNDTPKSPKYILQQKYGFDSDRADRILRIARECGLNNEPVTGGYVTVEYRKLRDRNLRYTITDNAGNSPRKSAGRVASASAPRYNQRGNRPVTKERTPVMPTKTRVRPAPEPEPEVIEDETEDLAALFVDKPPTPTMSDFIEWFQLNVSEFRGLKPEQILIAGIRAYGTFQKSEFNRERKAERRAEREVAATSNGQADEPEDEAPAPARPAKRGRKPATATASATPAAPPKRARSRSAGVAAEPF